MDDLKTLQDRIAMLSSNAESVSVQGRDIMAEGVTEALPAISRARSPCRADRGRRPRRDTGL